jgi:uncharacterized membrane protein YedE/YeeE
MTIDIQHFTPWASLIGGLLVGISASILIVGSGRIAGIAGIVGSAWQSLTRMSLAGQGPRLMFVAGLLMAPLVWRLFAPLPVVNAVAGPAGLMLAGLLVGVGVRMGNGCTSGHGVCGLSRFSLRSLANVMAFMGAGFATVFVIKHVI